MHTRLVALAATLAVACGQSGSPPPNEGPTLSGELRFVRTGGFAGVRDELTIRPGGRATLTVDGGAPVDFELTAGELTAVERALEAADLGALPSDSTGKQAPDTFSYVISHGGHEVRTNDGSVPPRVDALVAELNRIVQDHRR